MELRLLGKVAVRGPDGEVDLGPAKQRCVLAALALQARRRVPTTTLIDQVWGTDTQSDVRASLYTYVTRLRQVLRGLGVDVCRSGNGYVIDVPPDAVDVHRFTGLIAQARRRPEALREALDQWQGEPLPGLSGVWAERVRAGLRQQYLAALLNWADIERNAGTVIERVGSALRAYPYDERLIGAYLRALHQAGRTAEALESYQTSMSVLRADLGVHPGPKLQAIHLDLLRANQKQRPVPAQLPPTTGGFAGRGNEFAALDNLYRPSGVNTIVLTGMGGVGKSALAVAWAHRASGRFPGGQLYADLRGRQADPLSSFVRALGGTPRNDREAYQALLAERPVLVLVDNATDVDQIRPLVPRSGASLLLVTSRRSLGFTELQLGPLPRAESVEMLTGILGSARASGAADVAEVCADFPLALRIAAANLLEYPDHSLAEYADELRAAGPLHALETPDGAISLRAVIDGHTDAERQLIRALGEGERDAG